jgi:Fe-S-cluster formation regulator IscX/YfhJ
MKSKCDTDHYLIMAKLRERISVTKQAKQKCDLERFDLRKLNDIKIKEKYQVEISNRFVALENLDDSLNTVIEKVLEKIPRPWQKKI